MQQDWSTFTKKIRVKANLPDVYRAWTTQKGLESWFLRSAVNTTPEGKIRSPQESFQPGDTFHWMWHGYPDEVFERREVLEVNGKDYLRFMFTDTCPVEVKLTEEEDGQVLVTLTQSEIPQDEESKMRLFVGCGEGWVFYLVNLKSILEGGVDLRNKETDANGEFNA